MHYDYDYDNYWVGSKTDYAQVATYVLQITCLIGYKN